MRVPAATYRLQFNAGFRFADALRIVPYLHELGVTDLYGSPIFKARPGSGHGYDIIDPLSLNPELGTEAEFEALTQALRERGVGLLLDIVPNHMAASPENPWWADVLERGPASPYARYFDIDWGRGDGKVVLPILGSPLEVVLERGELSLDRDEQGLCLRYYDTRLPVAQHASLRSALDQAIDKANRRAIEELLAEQHYRLAYWRTGTKEINYRRFFDISGLVGVRVEDADVFEATHALIWRLVREGAVTGLRVDHIDGLYDPAAYLQRLRSRLGELVGAPAGAFEYVLVEKILTGEETLPDDWETRGTTGYDFLNTVNGLFVSPEGLRVLRETYSDLTGSTKTLAETTYEQKRRMATELFEGELRALAAELLDLVRRLGGAAPAPEELSDALAEVSAALPVYRTYVRDFDVAHEDRERIERAVEGAKRRNPALVEALDLLRRVLLLDLPASLPDEERAAWLRFVMRWQQFTGPLTAKGLEDTALYQHNPLVSINEVGVDPEASGSVDLETFHRRNRARRERWPHTLIATATHDTKRGEDTRARINVLSELADEWSSCVRRWTAWNEGKKSSVNGAPVPAPNEELLVYQTLVGAWPLDETEVPAFRDRLNAYLVKAAREAKVHTSWLDPVPEYEQALTAFADALLSEPATGRFMADFLPFQRRVAFYGATNSLAQLVLRIASPGVPDCYRGTELWDLTLVDPDNRRPVDFERRREMLDELRRREGEGPALPQELLDSWRDGQIKLYITAKALRWRRERRGLFRDGAYLPLSSETQEHVVAFARRKEEAWALVAVPRLVAGLTEPETPPVGERVWGDAALELPPDAPGTWVNVLTGETTAAEAKAGRGVLPLQRLFAHLPVALLEAHW